MMSAGGAMLSAVNCVLLGGNDRERQEVTLANGTVAKFMNINAVSFIAVCDARVFGHH